MKKLAASLGVLLVSCTTYSTPAKLPEMELIQSGNSLAKVLAAKSIGKKVKLSNSTYSMISSYGAGTGIHVFSRDKRVYNLHSGNNGHMVSVNMNDYSYYTTEFAARFDDPLEPGLYTDARRYPFNGKTKPGLDYSGGGHGCNRLSGKFNILEIEKDNSGNVLKFAADFEQHCEMQSTPQYGAVRYNSNLPATSTPAILSSGVLVIPLFKITTEERDVIKYISLVLHKSAQDEYTIVDILPADIKDEDIKVAGGEDYDSRNEVIPSVVEILPNGDAREFKMSFERVSSEDIKTGLIMKLSSYELIRT